MIQLYSTVTTQDLQVVPGPTITLAAAVTGRVISLVGLYISTAVNLNFLLYSGAPAAKLRYYAMLKGGPRFYISPNEGMELCKTDAGESLTGRFDWQTGGAAEAMVIQAWYVVLPA